MVTLKLFFFDLERQYYYEGLHDKKPTFLDLLKRSFTPRFAPVVICRISQYFYSAGLSPIAKFFSLINFIVFGIEIGLLCKIEEGLYLPHTVGTVIGASKIGKNATIFQGVTLGAKDLDLDYNPDKRPTIGDNVTIGAGAKILGGVQVGNNVTIGANSVVTKSIPDNVIVAGVPAKIIRCK